MNSCIRTIVVIVRHAFSGEYVLTFRKQRGQISRTVLQGWKREKPHVSVRLSASKIGVRIDPGHPNLMFQPGGSSISGTT